MMGSVIDTGGASVPVLMGAGVLSDVAGGEAERFFTGEQRTVEAVASDVAGGLVIGLTAGLVPKVKSHMGAAPTTRAVSALGRLTATAERRGLTVADDTASTVSRSTKVEVRVDVGVRQFRSQPGYAQHETSGRWYNVQKRAERVAALEKRLPQQDHHLITDRMVGALERVGVPRETAMALRENPALRFRSAPGGHIGYEKWHQDYDDFMVDYILRKAVIFESRVS